MEETVVTTALEPSVLIDTDKLDDKPLNHDAATMASAAAADEQLLSLLGSLQELVSRLRELYTEPGWKVRQWSQRSWQWWPDNRWDQVHSLPRESWSTWNSSWAPYAYHHWTAHEWQEEMEDCVRHKSLLSQTFQR